MNILNVVWFRSHTQIIRAKGEGRPMNVRVRRLTFSSLVDGVLMKEPE